MPNISDKDDLVHIIATTLNKVQKTSACHGKCLATLKKQVHHKKFYDVFFPMLSRIFLVFKREPTIERIVKFVTTFSTDPEYWDEIFVSKLIRYLLKFINAEDKAVRFRVSQIASEIMNNLPNDVEVEYVHLLKMFMISDSLWDDVANAFIPRLTDKVPIIRSYAIAVLNRLQDATDPDDDITQEYIRILQNDSNKDVRKVALENIMITKITLPYIIERTKDAKDDVRLAAFKRISSTIPMRKLTISQRIEILKQGLLDRCETVRNEAINMLCNEWLKQVDFKLLSLLESLDVENFKETCEVVLDVLFDKVQDKKILTIDLDFDNLKPESVLYWRCKLDNFKKHNVGHLIEKIANFIFKDEQSVDENLLTVTNFCTLMIKYQTQEEEFISEELLMIAKYLDYCDEIGRQNMFNLLCQMLITFTQPELYVKEIISLLKIVSPSPEEFMSTILRSVDELRRAAENSEEDEANDEKIEELNKKLKRLKRKAKELERERRICIEDEEYDEANDLKRELKRKNEEIEEIEEELKLIDSERISMWMRALLIMSEVFQSTEPDTNHMLYLMDDVVLKTWHSDNPFLRNICMKVLGQFCSLRKDFAIKYIDYFVNCLYNEADEIANHETALKAVFDILMIHGLEIFKKQENMDQVEQPKVEDTEIIDLLLKFFKSEFSELRTAVVEGFGKLLLYKRITYKLEEVISNQILMLFNPLTEGDARLRQCLTVFLPAYSFSYLDNMKNIANSFLSTVRKVSYPGKDSFHKKVKLLQLSQFLIYLCDPLNLQESQKKNIAENKIHETIALQLAYEILADSKNKAANTYCKLFSELTLYEDNQETIKILKILIEEIKEKITNKVSLRSLKKFEEILNEIDKTPDDSLPDDKLEEIEEAKKKHCESLSNYTELDDDDPPKKKSNTKKSSTKRSTNKKSSTKRKTTRTRKEESEEEFEDYESEDEKPVKKQSQKNTKKTKQRKKESEEEDSEYEDNIDIPEERSSPREVEQMKPQQQETIQQTQVRSRHEYARRRKRDEQVTTKSQSKKEIPEKTLSTETKSNERRKRKSDEFLAGRKQKRHKSNDGSVTITPKKTAPFVFQPIQPVTVPVPFNLSTHKRSSLKQDGRKSKTQENEKQMKRPSIDMKKKSTSKTQSVRHSSLSKIPPKTNLTKQERLQKNTSNRAKKKTSTPPKKIEEKRREKSERYRPAKSKRIEEEEYIDDDEEEEYIDFDDEEYIDDDEEDEYYPSKKSSRKVSKKTSDDERDSDADIDDLLFSDSDEGQSRKISFTQKDIKDLEAELEEEINNIPV